MIINYVKLHAEPAEGKTLDISKYIVNENVVLLALVLITGIWIIIVIIIFLLIRQIRFLNNPYIFNLIE